MPQRYPCRRYASYRRLWIIRDDDYVGLVATMIAFEQYQFDLVDLYERMWSISVDDRGDGTRLFKPRPGSREALKWLIEDLSGAMADPVRTTRANNALRQHVHRSLIEKGWVERITQVSFRLLKAPTDLPIVGVENSDMRTNVELGDLPAEGVAIADVPATEVSTNRDTLRLADLEWSSWCPLDQAAKEATTTPGVYAARSDDQIVYIGMAGERRGLGVRGRLQVYGRGRGAVSGLGEAALDRALADPAWLAHRLTMLLTEGSSRSKDWAVAALHRAQVELCWVAAPDAPTARAWETQILVELEDVALWNRARPTPRE